MDIVKPRALTRSRASGYTEGEKADLGVAEISEQFELQECASSFTSACS